MPQKQPINPLIFDGILAVLAISGFLGFWLTETFFPLKLAVILLFIFSFWQVIKKDNSAILFIIGFVDSTVLFRLVTNQVLNNGLAAIILFAVTLFLFSYRHLRTKHIHTLGGLVSAYNSLLALLIGELFYVLTFFPIEGKNKAILIVLLLWLYDEIIESYEEKRLTHKFTFVLSAIFLGIFLTLVLTFPFETGL